MAFCVPLALLPSLSGSDVPFSCLGFSATSIRVFRGYSTGFSLARHCFPSSSGMLLLGRGSLCALFFPSLYAFGDCLFLSPTVLSLFYTGFLVLFLVLPLSLWSRSCSSPASSSSSVPCRRVLWVCLQLRLRRRRVILLHFPLHWLLPLRLLSGFPLLLPFSGTLLLLAGFRCGLVVPAL